MRSITAGPAFSVAPIEGHKITDLIDFDSGINKYQAYLCVYFMYIFVSAAILA